MHPTQDHGDGGIYQVGSTQHPSQREPTHRGTRDSQTSQACPFPSASEIPLPSAQGQMLRRAGGGSLVAPECLWTFCTREPSKV